MGRVESKSINSTSVLLHLPASIEEAALEVEEKVVGLEQMLVLEVEDEAAEVKGEVLKVMEVEKMFLQVKEEVEAVGGEQRKRLRRLWRSTRWLWLLRSRAKF